MGRESRTPIRTHRKTRTGARLLSLLLAAALLLISIQFHRINAQLEALRVRLRQIERMTDTETETAPPPDTSAQTDYIDTLPVLDVGKPAERTDAEVLEQLNRLGKENPVIAEIAASGGDYPMALLSALANNPEMADFAAGYPAADANAAYGAGNVLQGGPSEQRAGKSGLSGSVLTETERSSQCPLFLQWDPRWGYHSYGSKSCVALSGCGPTCLSMVLFSLTRNETLTPDKIADYSMENGYYVASTGTAWALMEDLPEEYGIRTSTPAMSEAAMKALLDGGALIICAMSRGDFTLSGHFIVIHGYDREGFLVNDPNCLSRSRRHWTFSQLKPQTKGIWAYTKAQAQTDSYRIYDAG